MFEIKKGIPIPSKILGPAPVNTPYFRYPFMDMEIGDSFEINDSERHPKFNQQRVYGALHHGKERGYYPKTIKIKTKIIDFENGSSCLRVWRTA